jgi:nitroreductase
MISDREVIRLLAEKGQQAYLAFLSSIESPFLKEAMDNYGQNFFWFSEAPLIAAAVVRCPPSFLDTFCGPEAALFWGGHLSAAMGIENLLLMAPALGLGGCCLGGPLIVRTALAELLNFGPREELSLIAALGFSSES